MAEQELKACPFCGGERLVADGYVRGVKCSDCQGQSHLYRWNTRPIENALTARLSSAEAEVERLLSAINWALGVGGEFPIRTEGQGAYYWRTELARRAGLEYDGSRFIAAARRQQGGTDAR